MARPITHLLPKTCRALTDLGERLAVARGRRRLTRRLLAERAGLTEFTLRRVEAGEIGVTIGAYLAVMEALQLIGDLAQVAADDPEGRDLQDAPIIERQQRARRRTAASTQPAQPAQPAQPTVVASPVATAAAPTSAMPVRPTPEDLLRRLRERTQGHQDDDRAE